MDAWVAQNGGGGVNISGGSGGVFFADHTYGRQGGGGGGYSRSSGIFIVDANGNVYPATPENLQNTGYYDVFEALLSTKDGSDLWNYYMNSTDIDIYITFSDKFTDNWYGGLTAFQNDPVVEFYGKFFGSVVDTDGTLSSISEEFENFNLVDVSNSIGKKIALVSLNQTFFDNNDIFDKTEALYHELKAHIDIPYNSSYRTNVYIGHAEYGAFSSLSNYAEGSISANSPAGVFALELVNNYNLNISESKRRQIRKIIK